MNKKLLLKNLLVATTLALLFSGTASADDKKIIVTGRITAQTCTVVNPENCAILVPLRLSVSCIKRPGTCTH